MHLLGYPVDSSQWRRKQKEKTESNQHLSTKEMLVENWAELPRSVNREKILRKFYLREEKKAEKRQISIIAKFSCKYLPLLLQLLYHLEISDILVKHSCYCFKCIRDNFDKLPRRCNCQVSFVWKKFSPRYLHLFFH